MERLVEKACRVRCFVRYNSRNDAGLLESVAPAVKAGLEIVHGDLKDSDAVHDASRSVDVIFHLGSLISIPYSYAHPRDVIETNTLGCLNVMQAARNHSVTRVVHTSTSEVYGTALYVPIDEKHPLQAQSPYSASKMAADKIAESFHASFGLPVAILRPFNTYGPGQSSRAVIPTVITQVLAGGEVKIGSLTPTRDFTYVDDTVEAFIKIAECDRAVGGTFNAGSGFEISIGDLVRAIGEVMGKEVRVTREAERVRPEGSEVQRLLADGSRAYATFGWKASISLREGLRRTVDWIAGNMDRYKPGVYTI